MKTDLGTSQAVGRQLRDVAAPFGPLLVGHPCCLYRACRFLPSHDAAPGFVHSVGSQGTASGTALTAELGMETSGWHWSPWSAALSAVLCDSA